MLPEERVERLVSHLISASEASAVAEMLHIGGDFFAALDGYVQAVTSVVPAAHAAGVQTLHQDIQRRARIHPRWAGIAEHIETWPEADGTHIGVRHPEHVHQAQAAEYGDMESPPVPLLRHMPASAKKAADRMDAVLHSHLGIPSHQ